MGGPDGVQEFDNRAAVEQIDSAPSRGRARRVQQMGVNDRVNLIAVFVQTLEAMAADEAARACHEHAFYGFQSGCSRSLAEITSGRSGHSIANAGSSQRAPHSAAGL